MKAKHHRGAVARAFCGDVDYAMLAKESANERAGFARYAPSRIKDYKMAALKRPESE